MSEMTTIESVDRALAPGVGSRELRRHEPEPATPLKSRRGALTLALLLLVQFLDFLDVSIVNVALPSIKHELGFSEQSLQWVVSGYVLTYGGFLLLGGRAADLLGRRRILVGGLVLFALASLVGGAAQSDSLLIGARLAQGIGAAMMSPAALSILTTTFTNPRDRNIALGAWAAIPGLAGASGVVLGGVLTEGPGWRWIFFLNLPVAAVARHRRALRSSTATGAARKRRSFDLSGAVLVTGGMLLLIYALVKAPERRLGHDPHDRRARRRARHPRRLRRSTSCAARNPLVPLSIFRIKGLAAANATQLITFSGLYSMFFFLSLYMQNVLGYSPIQTGLAYLPLTVGFMIAAGDRHTALAPHRHQTRDRRRRAHRRQRRLLPLTRPCRRHLPQRPAPRHRHRRDRRSAPSSPASPPPPPPASRRQGRHRLRPPQRLACSSAARSDSRSSPPSPPPAPTASAGGANLPLALTAGFQRAFLIGTAFAFAAALIAFIAASARTDKHKGLQARPTPIADEA